MKKVLLSVVCLLIALATWLSIKQPEIVKATFNQNDGCGYRCNDVQWSANRYAYEEDFVQYSAWSDWSSCSNNNSCSSSSENANLCEDTGYGCSGSKEKKRTRTIINEHACPAGYEYHEQQNSQNDCRKLLETFGPITVDYEKWDHDPHKCHRETAQSLGIPQWAISKFNTENPEFKDGERYVPEGKYLGRDNMCHDKTPVCTDIEATNYDSEVSETEYSNNEICEYPEDPTDVCPNIEGDQAEVPEGYELEDGQCVEKEDPCEENPDGEGCTQPSPSPSPSSTPEPKDPKTSGSWIQTTCDGHVDVRMNLYNEGQPQKGVDVQFKYKAETIHATTNDNGEANVGFSYQGEDTVKIEASGYPSQEPKAVAATNCTGKVLGTSTQGKVLGAYAAAGVFEDTLMNVIGMMGAVLTATGSALYAKKRS